MKQLPSVGDEVLVNKRSNGTGRIEADNHPVKDTVAFVYADGRVKLMSGDIWYVRRFSSGWVTVK